MTQRSKHVNHKSQNDQNIEITNYKSIKTLRLQMKNDQNIEITNEK